MKLGILSDTHDQLDATTRAVAALRSAGALALVHCGDITGPAILARCAPLPTWFVFGNHDADSVPALTAAAAELELHCLATGGVFELQGKPIAVAHGHLTSEIQRVSAAQPAYLLTGHDHEPSDLTRNGIRRICPGSLFRSDHLTVAILDLALDRLEILSISKYPGLD
jgi:uncharacterized protein